MKVFHSLRMDLARCGCRPILTAVQGESNTRVLEVSLYNNGVAWEIPETAVIDVAFQKPDGTKGVYSKLPDGTAATSFYGNVMTATLAPQVLTCPGSIRAAFVFTKAGAEVLATFPFTITVEASPAADAERSEDYFNPEDISDLRAEIAAHAARTDNPHNTTASQVGARPDTWTPTAEEVGARPDTWTPTAEEVGARSNTWLPTPAQIGAATPADVQKIARKNLLDNWYFANPVNQRGQTSYDGSGYTIDRWSSGAISVVAGEGIRATYASSIIVQNLEPALKAALDGRVCTISVLCDGVMNTANFTYRAAPEAATPIMSGETTYANILTNGSMHLCFKSVGSVMQAAKLELGDTQTLAHEENGVWVLNEIPDYGTELLKCQRYYQLFTSAEKRPSDKRDFRPELRIDATGANTGTVTIDNVTYYYADANL